MTKEKLTCGISGTLEQDPEKVGKIDAYIDELDDPKGSLIHILHKAQEVLGYLPAEIQLYIARRIGVPASKVFGVVSFYSFFTQTPKGRHTISVCMGTACYVKGAEDVMQTIKRELRLDNGGTSEDGLFSLRDVRCVGTCGLAPIVMVDDNVYGHVTEAEIKRIIAKYREE